MYPSAAFSAARDLGTYTIDCETDYLNGQTFGYAGVGDSFRIRADYQPCLIEDPNGILTGEDFDHSGLGPGVVGVDDVSGVITINAPGEFSLSENGGLGATVVFRVVQSFLFLNDRDIGVQASVGDTFLYENVTSVEGTSNVDATATINQIFGTEDFVLDENLAGSIRTCFDGPEGTESYIEYSLSFHADNNPSVPVTVTDLSLTIKDIDITQYIAVQNVDSYTLDAETRLSTRTEGSTLFVEELNGVESETEDEEHWAVLSFDSANVLTIKLGSKDGGGCFDASFTKGAFAAGEFSNPSTTEITPPAPAVNSTPALAATGATFEWLLAPFLIATLTGTGFLVFSRRQRT